MDPSRERPRRRAYCRPCLDWTERRPHLGGAPWARRWRRAASTSAGSPANGDNRALTILPAGKRGLQEVCGVVL